MSIQSKSSLVKSLETRRIPGRPGSALHHEGADFHGKPTVVFQLGLPGVEEPVPATSAQ